uniref:Retinoid isomerohydrolase n=1 Tax=Oncorhynchus kisutch TaxID=8019 RepID=A0A8C7GPB7_ONCKI
MFFSSRDWETSQDRGKDERTKYREILHENLLQSAQDLRLGLRFTFQQGHLTQPRKRRIDALNVILMMTRANFKTCIWVSPCRFFTYFKGVAVSDTCLVNVYPIGEDYYAITETNYITKVNTDTLETLKKGDCVNINGVKAHLHGTVFNKGSCMGKGASLTYNVIRKSNINTPPVLQTAVAVCVIGLSHMSYGFHITLSFGIAWSIRGSNYMYCFESNEVFGTLFHIARKDIGGGQGEYVDHKFRAAPINLFHHVNTYEEQGFIVADVCTWKGYWNNVSHKQWQFVYNYLWLANLRSNWEEVKKNLICLPYTTATSVMCSDGTIWLEPEALFSGPRQKHGEKNYTYAYASTTSGLSLLVCHKSIIKLNLTIVVATGAQRPGYMLILNAKDMSEIARAEVKCSMPVTFHGMYKP